MKNILIIFSLILGSAFLVFGQPDFLVNDDATGGVWQDDPSAMAMNASGQFVVVWQDERNGDFDCFARRFDASGNPITGDIRVNEDAGTSKQHYYFGAGIDDAGNFVVAWGDVRDDATGTDVYARRFLSDGSPSGSEWIVNDDGTYTFQSDPFIAMNGAGAFAIFWKDTRENDRDLFGQLYDAIANPVGANFKVNVEGELHTSGISGSAGMDMAGNFVVSWADNRYNHPEIFIQRYASTGLPVDTNTVVNDDMDDNLQRSPMLDMNPSGQFVVVWQDYRSMLITDPDVYGQRFHSSGMPQGANFKANDDSGTQDQTLPDVGIDASGNFVVVWQDDRADPIGEDIFGQRFDASGNPQGANFKVNGFGGQGVQEFPVVGMDGAGNFVAVWSDDRGPDDLVGIRYSAAGSVLVSTFIINGDGLSSWQHIPAVDMNAAGEFVIAWQDFRLGDPYGDVYGRRFTKYGFPKGPSVRLHDDATSGIRRQTNPDVSILSDGGFVSTWVDSRDNNCAHIYLQRYGPSGSPLGSNVKVCEDTQCIYHSNPAIASDASGNFVLVWVDERAGEKDVYGQRFDAAGSLIGANFQINEETSNKEQRTPAIAMTPSGRFVVVWWDTKNPESIQCRIYQAGGTAAGPQFRVNENHNVWLNKPDVAVDNAGNFTVVWEDGRNGLLLGEDYDIYARRFDMAGLALDTVDLLVNDFPGLPQQLSPSVAMDPAGGRFVAMWQDWRDADGDPEIMAQVFNGASPSDMNTLVNEPDAFAWNHQATHRFAVDASSELILFAWADNRRMKGWDVYATLKDWALVTEVELPVDQRALEIWPNPTSDELHFKWISPFNGQLTASLTDLSGRRLLKRSFVKTSSRFLEKLDPGELPSGLYLLRLQAGDQVLSRKVMIQR
jgi:hypothetical protein